MGLLPSNTSRPCSSPEAPPDPPPGGWACVAHPRPPPWLSQALCGHWSTLATFPPAPRYLNY